MTTLESIGIDPQSHGYAASEMLLAGKLSKLIAYTKELEEERMASQKAQQEYAEWCFGDPTDDIKLMQRTVGLILPEEQEKKLILALLKEGSGFRTRPEGIQSKKLALLVNQMGPCFDADGWDKWRKDYIEALREDSKSVVTENA
jgi:hypothetical protein